MTGSGTNWASAPLGAETAPQCWCGNERLLPFSKHYVRCASCKTLVVARMPVADISKVTDDEKDFYGREYWLSHQKKDLGNPDIFDRARMDLPERAVHWLRALIRFKIPPAKVLELGCAHGGFTALLRWAGYDATGLEISPCIVEFGRKAFDVPILLGPLEEQNISPASLDVVALLDVLEHLPDPVATMRRCADLLKPGGFLLVQTPCYPEGRSYQSLLAEKHPFSEMLEEKSTSTCSAAGPPKGFSLNSAAPRSSSSRPSSATTTCSSWPPTSTPPLFPRTRCLPPSPPRRFPGSCRPCWTPGSNTKA